MPPEWEPITTAPMHVSTRLAGLELGPWLLLRAGPRVDRGRLRHAVEIYDPLQDRIVRRPAAWWGVDDGPLDFDPVEWTDDDRL